tara:strand:+ start:94784 stop:95509 length:726 start_codon:yes stop_codon:yes gene_type:complete
MTKQYNYTLLDTQAINSDIVALRLRPQEPTQYLNYQAGQYVISKSNDNNISFPLSIANAPNKSHELVFHLRHNQLQPQSQFFLKQVDKDKSLTLEGPLGKMTAENIPDKAQVILLAGGTGIAPFKALLENLLNHTDARLNNIDLFWGVRKPEDVYLEDWLKQIQTTYPGFSYHLILSDLNSASSWQGASGWVYEHALKTIQNIKKPTRVFASGPYEMVANSQKAFLAAGLDVKHFFSDMLN